MPSSLADPKVVVVGAGPAGCAAAITAARRGAKVVIVEKAMLPRDKCCGDGLTAAALRLLEHLDVGPEAVSSWIDVQDVAVRTPGGREQRFSLPRGVGTFAAVARRQDLDAALVARARLAGAQLVEGQTVSDVSEEGDRLVVRSESGVLLDAPFVIAADGVWSRLRKASGAGEGEGYRGEWHALRQYVRNVSERAASAMWVLFEEDLLPGYAWSFPLPEARANVGLGVRRRPGEPMGDLGRRFDDILARPHVQGLLGPRAEVDGPVRSWPIPARSSRLSAAGGRVLFAGDAARAGDPMTGEGVAQAMETGILAALSIEHGSSMRPAEVARTYEKAVGRALRADNRLAGQLSRVLGRRTGAEGALLLAGASPWMRDHFARWLMEDMPRALPLTPRRWRRGALKRPGAYR